MVNVAQLETSTDCQRHISWQVRIFGSYLHVGKYKKKGMTLGHILSHLQCEAPKIAKLVYNFNNYGLWYL